MLETGSGLDLLDEACGPEHRGEFGTQDFDRHFAVVPHVLGKVDGRHSTASQFAHDGVTVGDDHREAVDVAIQ